MALALMEKEWKIALPDPLWQKVLSDGLAVHPVVAQLLINRGIRDLEEARAFLHGQLDDLHDPFLLKNMTIAVDRIREAAEKEEKVLVYGDYDVDGVTSSALMFAVMTRLGIDVINHIPHRVHDGYGLNHEVADFAQQEGVSLLITVDCGTTSRAEVKSITDKGIDVIVIDHHEPSLEHLPDALAIINPKQADCSYPFKDLASVGLVVKLCHALEGSVGEECLDLAALGTVADVAPLRGENRILVKNGLPVIERTSNLGLAALCEVAKLKGKRISPHSIGFVLGPRINATGRMDSAHRSLDLFLSRSEDEALECALVLDRYNVERQRLQRSLIQEAIDMVDAASPDTCHVLVVHKEGWHKGVLGIVASRLADTYGKPAIVISIQDGVGVASARSVDGFHLYQAIAQCSTHLDAFGGHAGAAGLTIREESIEAFHAMINEVAREEFGGLSVMPSMEVDCEIPLNALDMELVNTIAVMEPFGEGNPVPLFCTRRLMVKGMPRILGKETLKIWLTDGQMAISAVGFGMAKYQTLVTQGRLVDVVYELAIDDWNKAPTVQMIMRDIKISGEG